MRFWGMALAGLVLFSAGPAQSEGLAEMVAELGPPAFDSAKSERELEYCIGLEISDWFQVGVLHGPSRTLVYGSPSPGLGGKVVVMIAIDDRGDRREIAIRANRAWNDRTAAAVRSCL